LKRMNAADIDAIDVHWRMAVFDPLREHKSGPARGLNSDRIESGGDVEISNLRGLPQIIAIVRREAFGTVEKQRDARCFEQSYALHCIVQDGLEMLHVLRQRFEGVVFWNALASPGLRHRLES